ncbi:MAG: PAS domain S-box protein [Ignavibacteria bacterium]|nr:PAS domain S-box protein [Ignavibacteria bacterium]
MLKNKKSSNIIKPSLKKEKLKKIRVKKTPAKTKLSQNSKTKSIKLKSVFKNQYDILLDLLNNTSLGVIEWDKNSKVIYWNKQAENIFGWKSSESVGKNMNKKIVPQEDLNSMLENVNLLLQSKIKTNTNESRNLTKNKKIIFCRWFNSITRNKKGEAQSVLSLVQDITVHKFSEVEKEKAIYDLNERVKELTLLNKVSTILQDTESDLDKIFGKILSVIPDGWQYPDITECRILFEDKIYKSTNYLDNSEWKQTGEFKISSGKIFKLEIIYTSQKPNEFEGPFLKEERNLLNLICSMIKSYLENRLSDDERKRLLNDLIQRNISLEKFAFIVSHNLRAPMANVLSISKLLMDNEIDYNVKSDLLNDLNASAVKFDSVFKFLLSLLETNEKT